MLSYNLGDHETLQKVDMTRAHYLQILSSVIDIIKQQSKAEWIGYGDDSTRYFLVKIKKRQTRQDFIKVKEVMQAYHQSLLGNQTLNRTQLDPQVIGKGNTLTVEQQLKLCAPFTDKEIKTAMFSIPNIKSPGPDGFSSGFFKATWHMTGGVINLVFYAML
ncbi:hypothetical protein Cgig2_033476 [Carnegiea gigantea]|uniref:Uncharacterized protein n=1 Tax=Carnegiea gigantea TaxID=171969 RepID=A0A9Q1JKN7_9CARY|nr:hypothetical protein Cgig2_033476 [Carnegiea gigantea]